MNKTNKLRRILAAEGLIAPARSKSASSPRDIADYTVSLVSDFVVQQMKPGYLDSQMETALKKGMYDAVEMVKQKVLDKIEDMDEPEYGKNYLAYDFDYYWHWRELLPRFRAMTRSLPRVWEAFDPQKGPAGGVSGLEKDLKDFVQKVLSSEEAEDSVHERAESLEILGIDPKISWQDLLGPVFHKGGSQVSVDIDEEGLNLYVYAKYLIS